MKYRVENIKSGAVLGLYEADSPEGAIRAMYIDAGYLDGEPPDTAGKSPGRKPFVKKPFGKKPFPPRKPHRKGPRPE